jgi:rhodanese-related sulfurtransferase
LVAVGRPLRVTDALRYRDAVTSIPVDVPDVDPAEADRLVGGGALLLDVREDDEWAAGRAPAAFHLPMGQVADRIGELPTDRTIVCMCRAGGRSQSVAVHLAGAGFDVRNAAGGMQAWAAHGLPVVDDTGAAGRVV